MASFFLVNRPGEDCYERILGEGQSMYLSMFVFSVHSLYQMLLVLYVLAIRSMKISRRELINNRFKKLNMLHLLPSTCLSLVAWLKKYLTFYKFLESLLSCTASRGWIFTCDGFVMLRFAINFFLIMCCPAFNVHLSWCLSFYWTPCYSSSTNEFS